MQASIFSWFSEGVTGGLKLSDPPIVGNRG